MLYDFDDVNRILSEMRDEGTIEPIDENDCHPMDWAEGAGLIDEIFGTDISDIYPEPCY